MRRPNVGYDFGSWGAALTAYPQIASKSLVVLTNDSLAGPYGPLDDLVARIEASPADVWAATDTHHPAVHLHSYLLGFRGGLLAREPLRGFFAGVRAQETKRAVIETYEFGLSDLVQRPRADGRGGVVEGSAGLRLSTDSVLGMAVVAGERLPVRQAVPVRAALRGAARRHRHRRPAGVRRRAGVTPGSMARWKVASDSQISGGIHDSTNLQVPHHPSRPPQRRTPSSAPCSRAIDPARIEASVRSLVSFGTRHTLSTQDDPVRGIGAARDWI